MAFSRAAIWASGKQEAVLRHLGFEGLEVVFHRGKVVTLGRAQQGQAECAALARIVREFIDNRCRGGAKARRPARVASGVEGSLGAAPLFDRNGIHLQIGRVPGAQIERALSSLP